jgi:Rod binding domain-containing protein
LIGNASAVQPAVIDGEPAKNLREAGAAGQFEALLIGQILKSMREEGSGWLGTGDDKAASSAMGFAEEQLAAALSAAGGLGLARIVKQGLQAPGVAGNVGAVPEGQPPAREKL